MINRYCGINVIRTYVDFLIKNIFYFYVYTYVYAQISELYLNDIISRETSRLLTSIKLIINNFGQSLSLQVNLKLKKNKSFFLKNVYIPCM